MERIHVKVPGEQPQDREYMKQALALAEKGHGWVNPNPMVGAVLVKDGRIIGEGYHTRYGQLHAEREAFKNAAERGEETAGADLYVTLEPCCHTGKQPPCTEAVLASGVKRVIVGCTDPNPVVAGRGIRLLREKGLEVVAGVLRGECERHVITVFSKATALTTIFAFICSHSYSPYGIFGSATIGRFSCSLMSYVTTL